MSRKVLMVRTLSIDDKGVLYSYGLFETIRVYKGVPFLLDEHLERLAESLAVLCFPKIMETIKLAKTVKNYVYKNDIHDKVIRFSVTYGNEEVDLKPNIFINQRNISYTEPDYKQGISLGISKYIRNEHSCIIQHKTFNYLENVLALQEIKREGFRECLFLNRANHVAEGSMSNIFFVKKDEAYTPAKNCGILPGITRQHVIDICEKNRISLHEGEYTINDLCKADECFCTNSVMEIMPVINIDGLMVGDGVPGKMTKRIMTLYRESVEEYIEYQK